MGSRLEDHEIPAERRNAILLAVNARAAGNQQTYAVISETDPALKMRLADAYGRNPSESEGKWRWFSMPIDASGMTCFYPGTDRLYAGTTDVQQGASKKASPE